MPDATLLAEERLELLALIALALAALLRRALGANLETRLRTGLNYSIGKLNYFGNSDNFCNFPNYFVDF